MIIKHIKAIFCGLLFFFALVNEGNATIVCVQNDQANNNVNLVWNQETNPCGPFVSYVIYASTSPSGPFSLVSTISVQTDTFFTHIGALTSSSTWYYYIEVNFACVPPLVYQTDTIQNAPPSIPVLVSASIENGYAVVTWEPSTSTQTCFYVIYYDSIRGNSERHDTVWGIDNTVFIDSNFVYNANNEPIYYTVEANDCCGQNNGPVRSPQRTIYLDGLVERCDGVINLNWTDYRNWQLGVKNYELYVSNNGSPYAKSSQVAGDVLSYDFSAFNDFDSLCFYIRAVNGDSSAFSSSNLFCIQPSIVQQPKYLYLTNITVINSQIQLTWLVDTLGEMFEYQVWNDAEYGDLFPLEDFLVEHPFLSPYETYIDTFSNPETSSYYYQIKTDDSCDVGFSSTTGRSIYLEVELTNYYEFSLKWNTYELENATIKSYNIYRNDGSGEVLLTNVPAAQTEYVNNISENRKENGVYCYRIEAVYDLIVPEISLTHITASSNTVCIAHRPIVHIPKALVYGGINNEFKPVILYGEAHGYNMQILNRWGEVIFTSNDINLGWDGTKNSQAVQAGGYAYRIKFVGQDGYENIFTGIVLLVK